MILVGFISHCRQISEKFLKIHHYQFLLRPIRSPFIIITLFQYDVEIKRLYSVGYDAQINGEQASVRKKTKVVSFRQSPSVRKL
jgi:hypothetical protein